MNKKITLPELVDALSETTGMQKKICESFIKDLIDVLQTALLGNESVKIAGLGTFKCVEVDARKSINVNTGEEIEIPSYRKVVLSVEKSMAQAVNSAFAEFETVEIDDSITDEMLTDDTVEDNNVDITAETKDVPKPDITETETKIETKAEAEPKPEAEASVEPKVEEEPQSEEIESTPEIKNEPEPQIPNEPEPGIVAEPALEPVSVTESTMKEDTYQSYQESKSSFKRGIIWGIIGGFIIALIVILGALLFLGDRITLNNYNETQQENIEDKQTSSSFIDETDDIDSISESAIEDDNNLIVEDEIKTDTIGRTRFLTTMAREYFGNFNFWVYIYLENKDIIDNPNKIKPGTVVTIPSAKKYDIDKNNSESIAKAQKLAAEIKNQFD